MQTLYIINMFPAPFAPSPVKTHVWDGVSKWKKKKKKKNKKKQNKKKKNKKK